MTISSPRKYQKYFDILTVLSLVISAVCVVIYNDRSVLIAGFYFHYWDYKISLVYASLFSTLAVFFTLSKLGLNVFGYLSNIISYIVLGLIFTKFGLFSIVLVSGFDIGSSYIAPNLLTFVLTGCAGYIVYRNVVSNKEYFTIISMFLASVFVAFILFNDLINR